MNPSLLAELVVFGIITTTDALRYLVPATVAYLGLWVLGSRWAASRRLGPAAPGAAQMRREFGWSMLTVLIFAATGYGIYQLERLGVVTTYGDVATYGWGWWWVSLALVVLAHDAYFYVIHRLLHRPWWFRHVHRTHHRSVHPSPWAAYAFHPVEAVLMALFLPLALLLMPLHSGVIVAFLTHMIARNVLGHGGVALTARNGWGRTWARLCTTTLHHDLHHSQGGGNYGLYFRHLDRWFGTERTDYDERLARLLTPTRRSSSALGEGST